MLVDRHTFQYHAQIPWPVQDSAQIDWIQGLLIIEDWLRECVGPRYANWAYNDCHALYNIGVAFKWDQDRTLFVLTWSDH
jgi:hypothetical protein